MRTIVTTGLAALAVLTATAGAQQPRRLFARSAVQTRHAVTEAVGGGTRVTTQYGSGTVIRADKTGFYVLTCRHVTEYRGEIAPGKLEVITHAGAALAAKVAAYDSRADLALLRVAAAGADVAVAEVADADDYRPGAAVTKVGYPGGGARVVADGVIADYTNTSVADPRVVSTVATAPSVSGDSGGGLFRGSDRKLVGVIWGGRPDGLRAVRLPDIHRLLRRAAADR